MNTSIESIIDEYEPVEPKRIQRLPSRQCPVVLPRDRRRHRFDPFDRVVG